ncbi:cell wall hydrolase [Devosia salina]|uniref:Cell wall hydrolase n=1 Tax=Devosia salina TaxID=2860336 RepID=A0ABX8WQ33_9HYPH|nr:cell wall hydrolase [Devosia salina]
MSEKECMMRAMYFESNRSSAEGLLAVGTVVMNRLQDARYPKSVCGVVGQKNQFAQGVLTRPMTDSGAVLAAQVADQVLAGARHPGVQNAQHFHTAGLRFPYNNMYYVLEAGGNEFYEKRSLR